MGSACSIILSLYLMIQVSFCETAASATVANGQKYFCGNGDEKRWCYTVDIYPSTKRTEFSLNIVNEDDDADTYFDITFITHNGDCDEASISFEFVETDFDQPLIEYLDIHQNNNLIKRCTGNSEAKCEKNVQCLDKHHLSINTFQAGDKLKITIFEPRGVDALCGKYSIDSKLTLYCNLDDHSMYHRSLMDGFSSTMDMSSTYDTMDMSSTLETEFGELKCGDTINGATIESDDINYYRFVLTGPIDSAWDLLFDSCGSSYDTWLYFYDEYKNPITDCDDCGSCGTETQLLVSMMSPGIYILGIGGCCSYYGSYTLTVSCTQHTMDMSSTYNTMDMSSTYDTMDMSSTYDTMDMSSTYDTMDISSTYDTMDMSSTYDTMDMSSTSETALPTVTGYTYPPSTTPTTTGSPTPSTTSSPTTTTTALPTVTGYTLSPTELPSLGPTVTGYTYSPTKTTSSPTTPYPTVTTLSPTTPSPTNASSSPTTSLPTKTPSRAPTVTGYTYPPTTTPSRGPTEEGYTYSPSTTPTTMITTSSTGSNGAGSDSDKGSKTGLDAVPSFVWLILVIVFVVLFIVFCLLWFKKKKEMTVITQHMANPSGGDTPYVQLTDDTDDKIL